MFQNCRISRFQEYNLSPKSLKLRGIQGPQGTQKGVGFKESKLL